MPRKKKKAGGGAASDSGSVAAAATPVTHSYDSMKIYPIPHTVPSTLHLANDSLSNTVNASDAFSFRIYDSNSDCVGRRAIAKTALGAGTLLLREVAQPWCIQPEHKTKVCASCAKVNATSQK